LAFSKKKIEGRKEWLNSFVEGTYLDTKGGGNISISDFVNKELILFSRYDLRRSIPSMVDGLKIGQRKILFGCFKRKLKNEIKVSQLAGYVSEHSAYHHGEQSLNGTIVKMAQNYVGSNNINILFPSGQFGTRLEGGKDAASARYIFTTLCQITRSLFHTADDAVLEYLDEDGLSIEPKYYIPVIPMVLVK
jgi:DNA topoisomerase II